MRDAKSVHMVNGKVLQAAVQTFSVALSEVWLLFRTRTKGIMFYDVPVSYVKEELRFCCELEPFNARNANSIRQAPREGGFSSLSDFAPIWISC